MKVIAQLEPKIEYKCPCGECNGEGLSFFNGIIYRPFENKTEKNKSSICKSCEGEGSL
jgi:hypothetical protein